MQTKTVNQDSLLGDDSQKCWEISTSGCFATLGEINQTQGELQSKYPATNLLTDSKPGANTSDLNCLITFNDQECVVQIDYLKLH